MNLGKAWIFFLFILSGTNLPAQSQISLFAKLGYFQEFHRLKFDSGNFLYDGWHGFDGEKIYTMGVHVLYANNLDATLSFSYNEYYSSIYHISPTSLGIEGTSNDLLVYKLDMLLGYQLSIWKRRIALTPKAGLALGFYPGALGYQARSWGSWSIEQEDGSYLKYFQYDAPVNFLTNFNIYFASGLEFSIKPPYFFTLFISADYQKGLFKAFETDVDYYLDELPQKHKAQYFTRASYFALNAGLKIPLNWIWEKKTTEN